MTRDTIVKILNGIDDEIVDYDGSNMLDDGIIDSFTIMEIVSESADRMGIKIDPDDITEVHFKTIDTMVEFVESIKK